MAQVNLGSIFMETAFNGNMNKIDSGSQSNFESFNKTLNKSKENVSPSKSDNHYKKQAEKNSSYQKNINKKGTSKTINEEVEPSNSDDKEKIDDQILALVSQALNLPVDEIKYFLGEMGLEAQDLTEQEQFSLLIGQAIGKEEMNTLLMESSQLEGIAKLFEDISSLVEDKKADESLIKSNIIGEVQEILHKASTNGEGINHLQIETVSQSSVNNKSLENDKVSKYDHENNLSFLNGNEVQTQDIGMTLPVHHFTTTTFTQSSLSENSTLLQTVTAKTTDSGQVFIEQIDFKVIGESKELSMQLTPKELGELNIKIVETNGAVVAEIKVDNEKARDLIMNEIHLLKENLEGQGINISEVKVDIRQDNGQSQMEQERQKSSKRIQEIISKHFAEEADEHEEAIPVHSDSEVNYMV